MRLTDADLKAALRNSDVEIVADSGKQNKTEARQELERAVRESLSRTFIAHWERNGLPALTPEYRFHPVRRWRFDFALPVYKIAIEVDGGTRKLGRHNRAEGYAKDAEKLNQAAAEGWAVFRFSDIMIKEGQDAMDGYL